jgi:trigger factor
MQIAETLNEGLKREYKLVVPAKDFAKRVDSELAKVASQIRMPGFRPGKVPANLVRKMHGTQVTGQALDEMAQESVQKLIADEKLRPAMQPKVELDDYQEGMDIALKVAVEVLPTVESPKTDGLKIEKLIAEPTEADLTAALERFAQQQKSFETADKKHAAAKGDVVVMDFAGSVDGEAFEGGTGTNMQVELGSGQLIPGFEDQLVGAKANDQRTVKVTFPDDYNVAYLKGRNAEFAVTVTEVKTAKPVALDDTLAKNLGLDDLGKLKGILKEQMANELAGLTRTHMKRKLLDQLAASHDFAVPESMVEAEFGQIWQQLEQEAAQDADPDAAKAALEGDRAEYRRIAERRVRLGLLLSEIGQQANVQVTQQEMNRLIAQEASRYPGEQGQVVKYFQENPMAAAQLRAPLYEDKVIDHLIGIAEISERTVTREALQAEIESDDETPGHVHGADCDHDHHDHHDHAPAKPKAKAKKAAAPAEAALAAEKPAKKAAAPKAEAAAPAPAKAAAKPKKAAAK